MKQNLRMLGALTLALSSLPSMATSQPGAAGHAPIGVMGDHRHKAGEWMVSYRFMDMQMEDNLQGSESINPEQIVTSVPNRFAGQPMMPPTLRVVPIDMQTRMHMVGLMYAPSDEITLMAMLNYLDKSMDHITFQGGMGTNQLGTFTTETSGLGDTKVALLYGLSEQHGHSLHLNLGVSIPTGDIEEQDQILTPMNMQPTVRLPYPMQLGSGTWDLEPGLTYNGHQDKFGWGAQIKYLYRISDNDEGYTLGDKTLLTGWASYEVDPALSFSLRLTYQHQDEIDGIDETIRLPVQTADPDNSGGEQLNLGLGVNFLSQGGHRLALEYELPLSQHANGVQMEMQSMLTLGYQLAF